MQDIDPNVLDHDVAFSRTLCGKECMACKRAYPYRFFDLDSSSRDGRKNICPECIKSPRLSTSEHLAMKQEQTANSHAVTSQRRPDEIDYIERNSRGRELQHTTFIEKLRKLLGPDKLIVGDAYFLDEFALYVKNPARIESNGVQYIGYISTGLIQEFSSYKYNDNFVPIDEEKRGYRGILINLIKQGYTTEEKCSKVFGPCDERVWTKTLFNWRNTKQITN